MKACENCVLLL